jgi:hypothetical protein
MPKADKIVWYTFAAVVIYLLLTHFKGANALLKTGFTGYAVAVQTLQGRGSTKFAGG